DDVGMMVAQTLNGEEGFETLGDSQRVYSVTRVALTADQVIGLGIETAPVKEEGRAAKWQESYEWMIDELGSRAYVDGKVSISAQLEALLPDQIAGFLEAEIAKHIDKPAY